MKTFLVLTLAAFVAVLPAQADSHRGRGSDRGGNFNRGDGFNRGGNFNRGAFHRGGGFNRGGGRYHGGYRGHRGGGRFYYFGGVPYLYPYSGFGYGDPYWYGGYYGGLPLGSGAYGQPYEGRIVEDAAPQRGARSLPGAVQRQLAERGYYKGGIDGQFGPASKSALKRFQRDNDLKSSGLIDEPTLKALGFDQD